MSDGDKPGPLRLRRKHGEGRRPEASAEDGASLLQGQSLRNAVTAGLVAIILFCIAWIGLTSVTNRVFPWMTVLLGAAVGFAVQRAGRGLDWRFPVLAAALTLAGAVASSIVVAASTTATEYGTGTLHILRAVTSMTWPVFFDEAWNIADAFFAGVAAGLAAFLAPRRLTRKQRYALRLWREQSDGH